MESQYSSLLKKHKLRVTTMRLEVLSVIGNYKSAIPYSKIQTALKDFDRVTLYRTMLALEEHGIIHKIQTGEQEVFYAMCGDTCSSHDHEHQHIHFKCTNCLEVTCVDVHQPFDIAISGHQIANVEIQANGICAGCVN